MKIRITFALAALIVGMSAAFAATPARATWLMALPNGSWWRPPSLPRGCMRPLEFRAKYDWALPASDKALVASENRACGKSNVIELVPTGAPNQCYLVSFDTPTWNPPLRPDHYVHVNVARIKCKRAEG